jgi:cytochrome P450
MITNALLYLLGNENPEPINIDAVIDESLRLEPAATVVDRYATTNITLATAQIDAGDLVRVSIAAANRDPAIFEDPDRYIPGRPRARRHLAFAQGPHVCLGIHLARLEARAALTALIQRLANLSLDPDQPSRPQGLVFRKPPTLHVRWEETGKLPVASV